MNKSRQGELGGRGRDSDGAPAGFDSRSEHNKEEANRLSGLVIGAAIEVHRILGPGLLESAYQEALCRELELRGVPFERQVALPMKYKGVQLDCSYRLDIVAGGLVIVELKSIEAIEPIHEAQLLTYFRLKSVWLGLLLNFNVRILKDRIYKIIT